MKLQNFKKTKISLDNDEFIEARFLENCDITEDLDSFCEPSML